MTLPNKLEPDLPFPTDAALVIAARAGNMDALAELYRRFSGPAMAVAYRILGEVAEAEDVVHDVFVGLPEALRRYDERGKLDGWIRRITAHVAISRWRRDRSGNETNVDDANLVDSASRDPIARITLETALMQLPATLRSVVVLKEIEGFSHAEIGAMLGISRGASEVRLHRAFACLRTILNGGNTR